MDKKLVSRSHARDYSDVGVGSDAINLILHDIFLSRGADYQQHHDYSLTRMLHPDQLKGLDAALALLSEAVMQDKRIVIVGDFDADGATSTALAIRCLQAFGCTCVDYLVPNRFVFGYGLTPEIVEVAEARKPDLIITVDNGISSVAGVALAREKGIRVLITDHHLPGAEVPDADAIVNPNQNGCIFPSKNLAGVGVCFYIMSALRKYLRERGWFENRRLAEPSMSKFLDLVALGTVADVVPLDFNNRVLVANGLKRIKGGHAVPGILALLQIAGRDSRRISSSDLGFVLGPRLNAAGRLDDMSLGIQCLLTDDYHHALNYGRDLDDLNRDRKTIETSMHQEALALLNDFTDEKSLLDRNGICLYRDDWHQGVIGILASRIKERLHRPTIVFAKTGKNELKGSGRSIPGIHLRDILDEIAATHPGMLSKFGGHAMAAGMSLDPENLDVFSHAFDTTLQKHLSDELKTPGIASDGVLSEALINLDLATALQQAGPWGQAFPEPVFEGVFQVVEQRIVGGKHLKLLLSREVYSNAVFDAIAFNVDLALWPTADARALRIFYQLDINEYRGNISIQLLVTHMELALGN